MHSTNQNSKKTKQSQTPEYHSILHTQIEQLGTPPQKSPSRNKIKWLFGNTVHNSKRAVDLLKRDFSMFGSILFNVNLASKSIPSQIEAKQ